MKTFSVRDLRERSGELSLAAEQGELSLVTKHGHPLFVSVPFTSKLLETGVHTALAMSLFKTGALSSGKAAKLCNVSKARFLEIASAQGIAVVDYAAEELANELAVFTNT